MGRVRDVSWMVTGGLLFLGLLLQYSGLAGLGWAFFLLFPFAVGFASVVAAGTLGRAAMSLGLSTLGLVIFLLLAIAFGLEGLVCALMAMPLLFFAILFGAIIAYICRKTIWQERISNERRLSMIALPLILLLVSDRLSRLGPEEQEMTTVTSSTTLPQGANEVFAALQAMDTLDAERPWLLEIGLPVPYKCVLEGEHVGAKRHCLFPNGHITAEITRYEPGELLSMSVTEYDLTGRHWFHFGDAAYTFEEMRQGTRVTRTSSYRSELGPRWYWAPLERMGIEQEHEFVLRSLKKNLDS